MTFTDLIRAVDELSIDEIRRLRHYIDQKENTESGIDVEALEQVFAELREGFTERDLEELTWAMNVNSAALNIPRENWRQ
jgi:hypothetical protein